MRASTFHEDDISIATICANICEAGPDTTRPFIVTVSISSAGGRGVGSAREDGAFSDEGNSADDEAESVGTEDAVTVWDGRTFSEDTSEEAGAELCFDGEADDAPGFEEDRLKDELDRKDELAADDKLCPDGRDEPRDREITESEELFRPGTNGV